MTIPRSDALKRSRILEKLDFRERLGVYRSKFSRGRKPNLLESYRAHRAEIEVLSDPSALLVLGILDYIGKTSHSDLSQELGFDQQDFANLIDRLSRAHFVMRSKEDFIHVTDWGQHLLIQLGMCASAVRPTTISTVIKTIVDYLVASVAIVLLLPSLVGFAILIKLDSRGPVFSRQRVFGREGRQFDAFKFRTMYENAEEILERHLNLKAELAAGRKLKDDPRITRTGRFLRKYSIDEIPLLFNVLLGHMSLVGPRMLTPAEVAKYGKRQLNLLTVKPGITGLWQISGLSDISYDERVRLDLHYIRNCSIWLDLVILWRTVPAVLGKNVNSHQ